MRFLVAVLLTITCSAALFGCAAGNTAFRDGLALEEKSRFEEAMYRYVEALQAQPDQGEYRAGFLRARDKAAMKRYQHGEELLLREDYAGAALEFQTAWGLDGSQEHYRQKMEQSSRLKESRQLLKEGETFEKQRKLREAAAVFARAAEVDPSCEPCKTGLARVESQRKNRLAGFELALKSSKPITLKFKDAKLKSVFTIITQLSGINFVFDEGLKDQNVTLALENATFQQSLDLLTSMFKLGRKTLNESTIIIYARTPEKTKQYEELVVRTFHLDYMDAKKAVAMIRTLVQVRKIHVNEESNSFMVRDTEEVVGVIEKMVEVYDLPEPEVLLDIEVVEISNKNTENLGLLLSNYNTQLGIFNRAGNMLSTSLGATTSTTSAGIDSLLKAFSVKNHGGFITVPYATYNLGKNLTKGEVLSNPKIRVKNREKSKFTVGTRVPITTSNTTNSTVSVNVQYVDVGVKVNAEPLIQVNNEVTIKLALEVSSILSREQVGSSDSATVVATIGTRNLDTVLSLKDGETSVIGGLISNSNSMDKNKLYLLGDIPLLGDLLSNSNDTKDKTELVLAITPRLVRGITMPARSLTLIKTGKEDEPSLTPPYSSFLLEPVYESPAVAVQQRQLPAQQPVSPAVSEPVVEQLKPESAPIPAAAPVQTAVPPTSVLSDEQSAQTGSHPAEPVTIP